MATVTLYTFLISFFSCYFFSSNNFKFLFIQHPNWGCISAMQSFGGCCTWQNLGLNVNGPWGSPDPISHPSVVKAQIPIALYQEINFSPSFQCFGKRMVKGAQFSAELHITAALQLVGSLDTILGFLESPGPGQWLGHLGSRGSSRGRYSAELYRAG